jgi:pimeloyl-ACP methyl ester carboxylesterase
LPSVQKLAGMHRASQITVVPNCGHVVNVEQPEFFNKATLGFLKSLN